MASSPEALQCPICKEPSYNLCLLQCGHSYCESCLIQWSKQRQNSARYIGCPECRHKTPLTGAGVKELPKGISMRKVKEMVESASNLSVVGKEKCIFCGHEDVTARCKQCNKDLCENCAAQHMQKNIFRDHEIILLKDNTNRMTCDDHPGEDIVYFCQSCKSALCTRCAQYHEEEHDLTSMEEEQHSITQSLSVLSQELAPLLQDLKAMTGRLENSEYSSMICKDKDIIQDKIKHSADKAITEIQEWEVKMLDEVKKRADTEITNLNGELQNIKDMHNSGLKLHESIAKLTGKALVKDHEKMHEQVAVIRMQVATLPAISPKSLMFEPIHPSPTFNLGTLQEYVLDETYVQPKDDDYENVPLPPRPPKPAPKPKKISPQLSVKKPLATVRCTTAYRSGTTNMKASAVALFFSPDQSVICSDLQQGCLFLVTINGDLKALTNVDSLQPRGLAVHPSGTIYVCDSKAKCVTMFNESGNKIGSWGSPDFKFPKGMGIMANGNVVVSDRDMNKISIFDSMGKKLCSFGKSSNRSPDDESSVHAPGFLTVDFSDNIIVPDSKSRSLKVYDGKGRFLRKITLPWQDVEDVFKYGSVCADRLGNIYVAQRTLNNVAKFSPDGQMIGTCFSESDGLNNPCGLVFGSGGLLAISEISDTHSAIKIFKLY